MYNIVYTVHIHNYSLNMQLNYIHKEMKKYNNIHEGIIL